MFLGSEKLGISTIILRSYEYYRTVPNIDKVNKILKLYKANINDISFIRLLTKEILLMVFLYLSSRWEP